MLGENLRRLRQGRGLTLQQLADRLNDLYPEVANFNKGRLSKWENNKDTPYLTTAKALADFFEVTVDELVGAPHASASSDSLAKDKIVKAPDYLSETITILYELQETNQIKVYDYASDLLDKQKQNIQVVGQTAAGSGLTYGDEMVEEVSVSYVPIGADKALYVKGDSMEPTIKDGSIVFYKEQAQVENGEIAIVEIHSESVTCKQVKYDFENKKIILTSINDKYGDMEFNSEEVRILGKVIL